MVDSSELPKTGDLIGVRYRIESVLGQGGMGAVFSAVNEATGRAVAIKWMLPGATRSKESIARFFAEARATAKIEHPNVIQILDVGQDGDAPFLVMERLRGRSLAERLQHFGRLTVEETLSVLIPACRGVAEAHTEGIIHRDLKPDNIFLCEGKDGSPRPPKVLDFGISKLYEEGGGPSLTRTGIAMGTPQYMSPEQLNAPPDADARFDVYAMGVVLYECLTGRPPYNADGLFELVQQIAAGNPTPIRVLSPDVPADLEALSMRAMAVNREYRPRTMPEFIAELERVWARIQSGAPPPQIPLPAVIPPTSAVHSGGAYTPHPSAAYTPHPSAAYTPPPSAAWAPANAYTGPMQYGHPPSGAQYPPSGPMMAPQQSGGSGMMLAGIAGAVLVLGLLGLGGVGLYFALRDEPGGTTTAGNNNNSNPLNIGTQPTPPPAQNPRAPRINLSFSGECHPQFNGRVMVTGNAGQVAVTGMQLNAIGGQISLMLGATRGTMTVSTQQRISSQNVIVLMVGQRMWHNMTIDFSAVQSGRIPDPVRGSLTINEFDADLARIDVTFNDVQLQNMQDGTLCTINGRLQTLGTTYGM